MRLGLRPFTPPERHTALRLDASGRVTGRRDVLSDLGFQPLVGLGQRGDRWGIVVAEGASLTLLPLDEGSVPFGAWRAEGVLTACDAAATERLRVLYGGLFGSGRTLPVAIRRAGDAGDFADVRLLTLEQTGNRVCVRRLWGTHTLRMPGDGGEVAARPFEAVHLTARGGSLLGTLDDGHRVRTAGATLNDHVDFAQGL